jgi:hypothetical protein
MIFSVYFYLDNQKNKESPEIGSIKTIDGIKYTYKCFQESASRRDGYEFENKYKFVLYSDQLIIGARYEANAYPANPNLDPVLYDMERFDVTILNVMETEGSFKVVLQDGGGGIHTVYMEKTIPKREICKYVSN